MTVMTVPERTPLPRRLGLLGAVAVLIGSTIGSGIFRSPASIADRLPGALPRTGGIYVFIREGWGRLPAFLFGWAELVVIRAAALGTVATTFAEYALRMRGYDPAVAPYSTYVHYIA